MQQQHSKLGSMKPTKIGGKLSQRDMMQKHLNKVSKMKSFGAGWGGEKPMKKSSIKKAKVMKGGKKMPSFHKVSKSVAKTMGY